jgi:hypothetical protein
MERVQTGKQTSHLSASLERNLCAGVTSGTPGQAASETNRLASTTEWLKREQVSVPPRSLEEAAPRHGIGQLGEERLMVRLPAAEG